MIVKEINGDLLEKFENELVDVIVHGCNCFHIMGAGIARQIRNKYPEAFEADKRTPCGDITKLGTFSSVVLSRPNKENDSNPFEYKVIINLYTQFEPGANFEYLALLKGLKVLEKEFKGSNLLFGFPQIGCGIGGGQWEYVKTILNKSKLKIVIINYDKYSQTVGQAKIDFGSEIKG
jgi:O-acetyl-ADP-ribose deacetylase (regulator of RNase III)